jgi:hypothetical protein
VFWLSREHAARVNARTYRAKASRRLINRDIRARDMTDFIVVACRPYAGVLGHPGASQGTDGRVRPSPLRAEAATGGHGLKIRGVQSDEYKSGRREESIESRTV